MLEKKHTSSWSAVSGLMVRAGLDWFLLALLGMIGLAYLWPEPGIQEGFWSLDTFADVGVSLIFFFYGLKLSPDKLKAGLTNWQLHLTIHLTTFVLFPAVVFAAKPFFGEGETALLWVGAFYVASLPSTVSSSVVMVSIAGGNLPAAIFNASISSLIGVFLTPVLMGLVLTNTAGNYDLANVIWKLTLQVLVPVILGLILNRWLGYLADRYKAQLRYFDQIIILTIVYISFCESFSRHLFEGLTLSDLLWLGVAMLGLFFLMYGLVYAISRLLRFNRPDRITALFCGSKKSLVQGSVMASVLFPGNAVGVVLLPIMMYHALQLIAASILAQRFGSVKESAEA